jgi:hypothetical protein
MAGRVTKAPSAGRPAKTAPAEARRLVRGRLAEIRSAGRDLLTVADLAGLADSAGRGSGWLLDVFLPELLESGEIQRVRGQQGQWLILEVNE